MSRATAELWSALVVIAVQHGAEGLLPNVGRYAARGDDKADGHGLRARSPERVTSLIIDVTDEAYEQQIAIRKAVEQSEADADPPLVIAKAFAHALTSDKPKTRYLAGHGGRQTAAAAALPDRARDRALAHELGLPQPE